jgi:hypothetical protein
MTIEVIKGLLTGMAFGAVLYKIGAVRYSRIMGMLTLRDTKVMKWAFATIATASLLYGLAGAFGVAEQMHLVPRVMPYLGGAHLLGGALFGLAMGWTGLCPGTCVAKTGGGGGEKKFVGSASILGLLVGILVYAGTKTMLVESGIIAAQQKPVTLYGLLGLPYEAVALAFGALMWIIAIAVDRFTTEVEYEPVTERKTFIDYLRGEWSWAAAAPIAGTLIVLATMQDGYLGFSGAALATTGWAASLLGNPLDVVPVINESHAWRAALLIGVLPGAYLIKLVSLPSKEAALAGSVEKVFSPKSLGIAFTSGVAMSYGAMVGGGCTTGAFLAAWPTLSLGSFAMAGTFFVVSMAVSNGRLLLLHTYDLKQAQLVGNRVYD